MGTIQIDGSTPKLTIGNATAEDATILFDGNAQDFYIALDDSADDLLIGLGSTVGTTPIIAIDENKLSTFSGAITVGVDDTGHDVKLFGASAGSYALWDESANLLDLRGATAAGPGNLKLTTGELTVVDADVLGKIEFQAPLEGSGTDAILVGASIWAEADDTFAAGVNNTDLVFALGKSEAAAEKFRFTADTEIGIGGANYGTDGQVLTSGGAGAACAWEDASGAVTALNNATANELVTVGATTTELDAESTLTFDGNALVVGGTAPSITIGDAGAEDTKLVFDGNAQDYHIGLDDSADSLTIGLGSTLGTTSHMVFDATGAITKPLQPAYLAVVASNDHNVTGDATSLTLGADVTLTEIYDKNGDVSSGTFTAPVTGRYLMAAMVWMEDVTTSVTFVALTIGTSNRHYYKQYNPSGMGAAASEHLATTNVAIVDMDANDTSTFICSASGTSQTVDVIDASHFSIELLG
jgi:hypothetical protein